MSDDPFLPIFAKCTGLWGICTKIRKDMIPTLIKGFITGYGASVPLGPLGVLVIQKTLSRGRNSGFFTGLGSSLSDTFYAGIALISLAFIQKFFATHGNSVYLVAGIVIIFFGIKVYFTNPIKQIAQKKGKKRHLEDFFEGFAMTITNPGSLFFVLWFFTFLGVDTTNSEGHFSAITTLTGVLLGTMAWWLTLSTTIDKFRKHFRIKQLITMNKISGVVIIFLGFMMSFKGVLKMLGLYPF